MTEKTAIIATWLAISLALLAIGIVAAIAAEPATKPHCRLADFRPVQGCLAMPAFEP